MFWPRTYQNNKPVDRRRVAASRTAPLIFRQLFEKKSSTFTYLLACSETREAVLIDPVDVTAERDLTVVRDLELNLIKILNTHVHFDHITASQVLRESSEAQGMASVISQSAGAKADEKVSPGDTIKFGTRSLEVRATPGHTAGCVSFVLDDHSMVFTGDALLIRGCGRADLPGGSADKLWDSVRTQLFTLPPACAVFPAHDYKGWTQTSIGEEMKYNPRLTKSKEEFKEIMAELGKKLSPPSAMDYAVPINMQDGLLTNTPNPAT